jgi:3-hydroxyacyl-CoA dehydrogenase
MEKTTKGQVEIGVAEEIAVVTIDNPPVNALSPGVPEAIIAALAWANDNSHVRAVVLTGAGNNFVAGADINEFVKMTSGLRDPGNLQPFLRTVEDSRKPVVAAIQGFALGGGLELAMACHYRVALSNARVGQPEVKLGLIPGAAGTQRLPRLTGIAKALEMCTTGESISAKEAHAIGIFDRVFSDDILKQSIAFAREKSEQDIVKTRDRSEKRGTLADSTALFAETRNEIARKQRALQAPLAAVEAIEAGLSLNFDDACKNEREIFKRCLFSDQSKALVHVFLAEREAARISGGTRHLRAPELRRLGVFRSPVLNNKTVAEIVDCGFELLLYDEGHARVDQEIFRIKQNYRNSVHIGTLSDSELEQRLKCIEPAYTLEELANVDLLLVTCADNLSESADAVGNMGGACNAYAVLAPLDPAVSASEAATSIPERVARLHFVDLGDSSRLVEIACGSKTGVAAVSTCVRLAKRMGKVPVITGDCVGLVADRMFIAYLDEAEKLVEEGADFERVDGALCDFGMSLGPFTAADSLGLKTVEQLRFTMNSNTISRSLLAFEDSLRERHRNGKESGRGWYDYDTKGLATSGPEVAELLAAWRARLANSPRDIPADEIVERCVFRVVAVGCDILEKGCVRSPGDIDTVWINGYGFPAYLGGPMWYADVLGLQHVLRRIEQWHVTRGAEYAISNLLRTFAIENKRLADFRTELNECSA